MNLICSSTFYCEFVRGLSRKRKQRPRIPKAATLCQRVFVAAGGNEVVRVSLLTEDKFVKSLFEGIKSEIRYGSYC